jgi:hypothetical protein
VNYNPFLIRALLTTIVLRVVCGHSYNACRIPRQARAWKSQVITVRQTAYPVPFTAASNLTRHSHCAGAVSWRRHKRPLSLTTQCTFIRVIGRMGMPHTLRDATRQRQSVSYIHWANKAHRE